MTDPPPKKVGSLRDRIAAFENKGSAPAPAPAPVPRPKPGHIVWQPKAASPPTSPRRDSASADDAAEAKHAGMSAADAKESIGKLSLKERMAALQGSTAFGGPAGGGGPPPPRPTTEKPKWKPPPVVQRVEPIGGDDEEKPAAAAAPTGDEAIKTGTADEARSPPATEDGKEPEAEGEQKEEGEPDPEEEERQRRAALAARMARLGGARVGMGPPIFGKKPDIPPKKIQKAEEKPKEEETAPAASHDDEKPAVSPSVQEAAAVELPPSATAEDNTTSASTDYFPPARKGSDTSSLLSPESVASPPQVRSPVMPVPQAPKRAAPPRKRPAKSPSPAPAPVIEQELHESPSPPPPTDDVTAAHKLDEPDASKDTQEPEPVAPHGDLEPEVTESQLVEAVEAAVDSASTKEEAAEETVFAPKPAEPKASEESHAEEVAEPIADVEHITEEPALAHHDTEEEPTVTAPAEEAHPEEHVEKHVKESEAEAELEPPVEEPEEDEAARRKRIAERLAKSGGFNPFAGGLPPPVMRRDSADSARSPPPPMRRDSQHEAARSPSLPATSPKPHLPERKASVGSVHSVLELPSRKQSLDDGGVSREPHASEQSTAPAREVHAEPIEEAYEDEDEATDTRASHEVDDRPDSLANEEEEGKYDDRADHEITRGIQQEEPETYEEDMDKPVEEYVPPPPASRPLPTAPVAHQDLEDDALSPPPPPRRNFPPPPPRAAVPPPPPPPAEEEQEDRASSPEPYDEDQAYTRHAREVGPEHEDEERHVSHDDEDEQLAHFSGEYEPYADDAAAEHEDQPHDEYVPPPPPPRRVSVPPPPPAPVDEVEEEEPVAPPPPPPRRSSVVPPPPPTHAPLPVDEYDEDPEDAEPGDNVFTEEPAPAPHPRQTRPMPQISTSPQTSAAKAISPRDDLDEHELLNDSDGDPIDPGFYSPLKSPGPGSPPASFPTVSPRIPLPPAQGISPLPPLQRVVSPPLPPPHRVVSPSPPPPQRVVSPPPQRVVSPPADLEEDAPPPVSAPRPPVALPAAEQQQEGQEEQEDAEQARRRTIAERMAKLGGIRFGAPPPIPAVRRPPPPEPEAEANQEEGHEKPADPEVAPQEEEEDEFARKQRIAARIAGMGGMRFGMLPGAVPPKPAPRVHRDEEAEEAKSPVPPKRSAPVPPPPPPPPAEEHEEESDYQHVSDSDHVGHEESELEEVTYTDAEEEEAPPVPDRSGRRVSTGPPPVPHTRPLSPPVASPPPVPRTRPPAPPAFTYPPPPHAPPPFAMQETQGDFVMVDQAENVDEPPPPPPPRAARPPPRAPPRAPPAEPETTESQQETPPIPNIDFGGETDLSLSAQWSEDSTQYPPAPPGRSPVAPALPEQPPAPPPHSAPPPSERHFTPDELQAHWGRVGVQVHEISASYYEKSKKHVIGDGSYIGFVHAVLSQVPNAAQPTESLESFGYLVYSQSAAAVQRRVSDIMPGDVIVVNDAKFKGHKGLQSYNQTVGVGAPLVGIISDFEPKKSKVKVYQANQHVGQQSVESASYRLEDLKSGSVKIYRVLEA
ncbi:hypothetical protein L226DRAFT_568663 [Lentinus tigrinus ALCF2SS1-7]|uniref:BBC1/AIM3 cysteine proteinase-fold domain-containing protein n=1 Tax=Lentinus tigrinus ALCF2SS1-6 TaxID=1328759 RepID=A0A5C2SFP9_9APHY|nr:hypothetical protein L227DRAFT_609196 [Lentinus tigrinus ALCF2SS1-6]RPD77629.1 hypothetical protein L226DRAFT_568663 [Lentinus tigrinus ALCF2SS1-7]